jgi:hypothetical protein
MLRRVSPSRPRRTTPRLTPSRRGPSSILSSALGASRSGDATSSMNNAGTACSAHATRTSANRQKRRLMAPHCWRGSNGRSSGLPPPATGSWRQPHNIFGRHRAMDRKYWMLIGGQKTEGVAEPDRIRPRDDACSGRRRGRQRIDHLWSFSLGRSRALRGRAHCRRHAHRRTCVLGRLSHERRSNERERG